MRRALLLAAALIVVVIGCRPRERAELIFDQLSMRFEWFGAPAGEEARTQQIAVCGATETFLMHIDTSDAPSLDGWDYTFLFGEDHNLRCPDEASYVTQCEEAHFLGWTIPNVSRVMLEGLSVSPNGYLDGFDVTCRGIADDSVRTADIEVAEGERRRFLVTMRMLKVGATTPLVSQGTTQPHVRWGAAASFADPTLGLGMDPSGARGRILHAGGLGTAGTMDTIYELDTQTLTMRTVPLALPTPVGGLSATTMVYGTQEVIAFAGGANALGVAEESALFVDAASASTTAIITFGDVVFHGAAALRWNGHWYLALTNGTHEVEWPSGGIIGNAESQSDQVVVFVPPGSVTRTNGTWACNMSSCISGNTRPGHGGHAGWAQVGEEMFLAGGSTTDGGDSDAFGEPTNVFSRWDFSTGQFTPALPPGFGARIGAFSAIVDSSLAVGLTGAPVVIGGIDSDLGFLDTVASRVDSVWLGHASIDMRVPRAFGRAVSLRDHTVLVIGGMTAHPAVATTSLEIFVPIGPNGGFFWVQPPGGSCDADAPSPSGCAALLAPRYGHTATRLDATQTWLDGAVLVVGGTHDAAAPPAELYVPAYVCGVPVDPHSNATLPPICDRGRLAEPLTHPKTKATVAAPVRRTVMA